jgi:hypothetical protein
MPVDKLRTSTACTASSDVRRSPYPVWQLGDKQHVEDLRAIATTLVQLQVHWMDWLAKGDERLKTPKSRRRGAAAWIKIVEARRGREGRAARRTRTSSRCSARPRSEGGLEGLGAFIAKPDVLGVAPRDEKLTTILFAPTRRDFVELLGYAGHARRDEQERCGRTPPRCGPASGSTGPRPGARVSAVAADKEFKTGSR